MSGYRSILVHLDESERRAVCVNLAVSLAREHGSHLLGLAATGLVRVQVGVAPALILAPEYIGSLVEDARGRATRRVADFTQHIGAAAAGLSCEGVVDVDDDVAALIAHGRYSDLIVLSQTDHKALTTAVELPERVLLQTARPVIVVPHEGNFTRVGQCVLVAWRDTREAVMALQSALPILQRAAAVTLLCIGEPADAKLVDPPALERARLWLKRHGVQAQAQHEITGTDPCDALLAKAAELSADLIVMGGYGHARWSQVLLGGMTRSMLARMSVPVLLAH